MGEGPLISVIVPIYNVEKYIYKSIESVRNQTYQNLEIILVDDGSQDNCGRIADEFAQKDKRIKVIHKENGGLSDARNAGLRIASGLYIYFFDSDDLMTSNLIETALSVYMRTDTDLVCFNYIVYDEITGREKKTSFPVQSCKIRGRKTNLVTAEYLGYRLGYCVWNKLYRADIIKKNRIFFGFDYWIYQRNSLISQTFQRIEKTKIMYNPGEYYFVLAYIMGTLKFHWGL